MLRIAIQAKGRLNEQSIGLLSEAGIGVAESKRKLISRADGFPMEVLYLRDDDIPQAVAMGVADLGIVGLNEVAEKNFPVERTMDLGFGSCRISLAVDRTADYNGLDYFRGKRVATSYPNILARFFAEKGIDAEIHTIEGSVEIAPAVGMSDAIFDIVSSSFSCGRFISTYFMPRLSSIELKRNVSWAVSRRFCSSSSGFAISTASE